MQETARRFRSWAPARHARPAKSAVSQRSPGGCGPESAACALLLEQIRRDTGRVLGLENLESLPNNKPLGELGMDSLMAVELRNALASTVGENLPATLLFDYPTVETLTEFLSRTRPRAGRITGHAGPFAIACICGIGCAWTRSRTSMMKKLSGCSKREKRKSCE